MRNLGSSPSQQRGLSLLLSLLLLAVLSVIAVAAVQTGTLQERVAGNTRDRIVAFNAAESALRDAEAYMRKELNLPLFDGSERGHFAANTFPGLVATNVSAGTSNDGSNEQIWRSKEGIAFLKDRGIEFGEKTEAATLPGLLQPPVYILEELPVDPSRATTYRITALASGRDNSVVVLQSHYTPPQNRTLEN